MHSVDDKPPQEEPPPKAVSSHGLDNLSFKIKSSYVIVVLMAAKMVVLGLQGGYIATIVFIIDATLAALLCSIIIASKCYQRKGCLTDENLSTMASITASMIVLTLIWTIISLKIEWFESSEEWLITLISLYHISLLLTALLQMKMWQTLLSLGAIVCSVVMCLGFNLESDSTAFKIRMYTLLILSSVLSIVAWYKFS